MLKSIALPTMVAVLCTLSARGDDVLAPVTERFAADSEETPDFQRHVVPLLGKLGCNGRACHGSFQGRGGFRLSLFGYDFKADQEALSERVDLDDPAASYALHKPTLQEPHEGGQRMDVGSWEYNVLLSWIKGGANPRPDEPAELESLEVTPREIVFNSDDDQQQLRAVAVWSDGVREDVTSLCRFQANDETMASVNETGLVAAGTPGDSHVVVFYDNAVVPVPVLRPVSDQTGDRYPPIETPTVVDELIVRKLRKLGIVPSEVCSDAEFLRRVTLDLAGTLPTSDEVREFLADGSADKRSRKVDELLETPAYAAWWTTKLCDWTGNSPQQLNNVNAANRAAPPQQWYDWIYKRVDENVPYDEMVEGLVLARGRKPGEDYRDYCERMSALNRGEGDETFADQDGMVYYWARRNFNTSEEKAIGFAYTFMGTRIQCAQCHKHPFDVWTQADFKKFEEFFERVRFARNGGARRESRELIAELGLEDKKGGQLRRAIEQAARDGKTVPFADVLVVRGVNRGAAQRKKKKEDDDPAEVGVARLLGGETVDLTQIRDPRTALMDWLRNDQKQLFAKAFVNRVWANYFHRGIVEPTDDLSLANPPSNDPLLQHLAQGFVEHGYDMHWVHREICNSETYQRSWKPTDSNVNDERNFSRAVPRRLPAEVAYDAVVLATAGSRQSDKFLTDLDGRMLRYNAGGRNRRNQGPGYALTVFGRSTRENNCDCDRSADASLLQTVFLRNDNDALQMIDRDAGWISEVTAELSGGSQDSQARRERPRGNPEQRERVMQRRMKNLQEKLKAARESGNQQQVQRLRRMLNRLRQAARRNGNRPGDDAAESQPKDLANVKLVREPDVPRLVEEAYLRTVSRNPTDDEQAIAAEYIADAENPLVGLRDLMWSLLNTKEFIVNH